MPRNPSHKQRACLHCGQTFTLAFPSRPNVYCSKSCAAYCMPRKPLEDRFWAKVDRSGTCWIWTGARGRIREGYGSYGVLVVQGRPIRAHRFSWELHNGPIEGGLLVCHDCPGGDNPLCVNPAHLFLGTSGDNTRDAAKKGRMAAGDRNGSRLHPEKRQRGDGHPMAKLTSEQVESVRASTETNVAIAKRLGVTDRLISAIRAGKVWKHLLP